MIEEAFARLDTEWRSLSEDPRATLDRWDAALERIAADEEALRARGSWVHGREDAFGVLGIERAELRHSAMIGWLLDPCGRHGFGPKILAALLKHAFPSEAFDRLAVARVQCEVARGDCRADIVVTWPGGSLVIENKVDAEEGERQCDILFEQFSGARFILLSPKGRPPVSAGGAASVAFQNLSYGTIRAVLAGVLQGARCDSVARQLAANYVVTLEKEFQ